MESASILVVEDEAIVAMDLRNRLRGMGHTVPAIASSGEEAVNETAALRPDLVLMDIKLRGEMDGVQAAGHIRHHCHVPVVYLTANSDETTFLRAKHTEPFGYLLKPFVEKELETTIEMALHRHRSERKLERSEALKTAILESALDCIITIDHEGRIVEFNPSAERAFGYTRAQALGQEMGELIIPPALREQHWRGISQYLLSGKRWMIGRRLELTALRSDGTEFPVELTITQIELDGPPMFTGYLRDITEPKRIQAGWDQRVRELQAALARVKALSGMLSICACCKKIRDEAGQWQPTEVYVQNHSEAVFSHGYCPPCAQKIRQDLRDTFG